MPFEKQYFPGSKENQFNMLNCQQTFMEADFQGNVKQTNPFLIPCFIRAL